MKITATAVILTLLALAVVSLNATREMDGDDQPASVNPAQAVAEPGAASAGNGPGRGNSPAAGPSKTPAGREIVSAKSFSAALDHAFPSRKPGYKPFPKPKVRRLEGADLGKTIRMEYATGVVRYLPDTAVYDPALGRETQDEASDGGT